MLEDGLRSTVDQVLGFFETKVGKGTDLFDDLDLLVASAGENDVKFVLLSSGFAAATKDLFFYTDGDGQYDVRELPLLLAALTPNVGLVNGYKLERHDPWHRIVIGKVYNQFARLLFRIRLRDIDCDFRLIRRELLQSLKLTSTSGTICVELVRKIELSGCGVAEVGVHHYSRLHGRSQFFRLQSLANTLAQLLRLYLKLVILRR